MIREVTLGATPLDGGRCRFLVWAPKAERVDVVFSNSRRAEALQSLGDGMHEAILTNVPVGSLYRYRLNGADERPDPASRSQPQGVHGPSEVETSDFAWSAPSWHGVAKEDLVLYELHVGTFSKEGTFDGVIPSLDELKALGVTALSLMPVAQFPGTRNWGYDGVYPFAVQNSYGGRLGLKRLIDACHVRGLGVVIDVVYNHFGPEGNYTGAFGPYCTDRYKTPWGEAINFDGPESDHVRQFFLENALMWIREFRADGLRLDAVHAIRDFSAVPFLAELAAVVRTEAVSTGRKIFTIAESDLNDARLLDDPSRNGFGLDAQWTDDLHHALHVLLTSEQDGYYADFCGVEPLAKAFQMGYVYTGEPSAVRRRRHGNSPDHARADQFVVHSQTHDQVGNRMLGERLISLTDLARAKLAAATILLSPFIPMIFMGEEYGEKAPFLYFVEHSDADLIAAVRKGRRDEFSEFTWKAEPPDPQDAATFSASRLNQDLKRHAPHAELLEFYRELLRLRREIPALHRQDTASLEVTVLSDTRTLIVRRWFGASQTVLVMHFAKDPATTKLPIPAGSWERLLSSALDLSGTGDGVSSVLKSDGYVTFSLQPWSVFLLSKSI